MAYFCDRRLRWLSFAADLPGVYQYPFETLKQGIVFSQLLTRFGEAGARMASAYHARFDSLGH